MENNDEVTNSSLYRAAIDGDSGLLLNLLATHPNLLDQFAGAGPYKETPLHVAVQLGHTQFVKEMIDRKPELSSKLNSLRSSPLHLAAAAKLQDNNNSRINLVKLLLQVNPEMCSVHDKFGNNPIHVAAINGGGVDVLKAMIQARPLAVKDKAKHGNTVLHLCVKHGKLETLKQLLQLLGDDRHFVNSTNDDGDTILHLAAANKHTNQIFQYLINNTAVEVSTENLKGWTAFNILAWSELDTEDASSLVMSNPEGGAGHDRHQTEEAAAASNTDDKKSKKSSLIKDMKKIILLVATLIAGIAFQALINPPGGVLQVSTSDLVVTEAVAVANLSPSPAPAPAQSQEMPIMPGTPVMGIYNKTLYDQYSRHNTVSFLTAVAIIYLITALADHPFGQRTLFVWIVYGLGGLSIASLSNAFALILEYYYSASSPLYKAYTFFANALWIVPVVVYVLWIFKICVQKAWTCIWRCCCSRNNYNRVTV